MKTKRNKREIDLVIAKLKRLDAATRAGKIKLLSEAEVLKKYGYFVEPKLG